MVADIAFGQPLGTSSWCHGPDFFLGLALIIVASPPIELGAQEPMLVEAFVVLPAIEGLDVRVLVWLARLDQTPLPNTRIPP